jgi:hypothetical protein
MSRQQIQKRSRRRYEGFAGPQEAPLSTTADKVVAMVANAGTRLQSHRTFRVKRTLPLGGDAGTSIPIA